MSNVLRVTQAIFYRIFSSGSPIFIRLLNLFRGLSYSWYLLIPVIFLITGSVIGFIKRIIHS